MHQVALELAGYKRLQTPRLHCITFYLGGDCGRADYVQRYAQPEHILDDRHGNGHQNGKDGEDSDSDAGFLSSSEDDEPVTGAADL